MRRNLSLLALLCLAFALMLGGCAGISLKESGEDVTVVTTSTAGYLIGDKYPELIDPLCDWAGMMLLYMEYTHEPRDVDVKEWLKSGFNLLVDDPFLRLQWGNLLRLIEIDMELPATPAVLTPERIKLIRAGIEGFRIGLEAARPIGF